MWKKPLILFLAAVISLSGGFAVGYVMQNGGFAGLPAMLGFGGDKENTETDWSGKTLTTGENIVNVRVTPESDSEVIATLNKNTEVVCVNKETPDWCYVKVSDVAEGYVVESFMSLVEEYTPTKDKETTADKKTGTDNESASKTKTKYVSITGEYGNIRKEAATDSDIVGASLQGDVLEKISEKDGWIKVKNVDGVEGYISADLTKDSTATKSENVPRKKVKITNSFANMRKEATPDSDLITKLGQGNTVTYLGEDNSWYHVLLDDGQTAYVRNDLATVVED